MVKHFFCVLGLWACDASDPPEGDVADSSESGFSTDAEVDDPGRFDAVADPAAGRCAPRLAEGAACPSSRACASYLACLDGHCRLPAGAGEPCESLSDCTDGFYCNRDAPEGAACEARKAEGSVCEYGFECIQELECINDLCQTEREEGEACTSYGDCVYGLYCRRLQPDGSEVEVGTCTDRLPDGAECDLRESEACEHACVDGRCQPRDAPAQKRACEIDSNCGAGQYCDQYDQNAERRAVGQCAPAPGLDEPCQGGEFIREYPCDRGSCFQGVCVDDVRLGGACGEDTHCDYDLYCLLPEPD